MFDGDCGICRTWVDYWQQLTGDRVTYRPYQDAADDFPAISRDSFRRAVKLIEPDGTVLSGAAATFKLDSYVPGHGAGWWMYRNLPGFAPAGEAGYAFFAAHRNLLARITHVLWGRSLEPARYELVSWLFLRGLGLIYLAAFVSVAQQIQGLVGSDGILPVREYLDAAHAGWGSAAYWRLPTLFWINASDATLTASALIGIGLSVALAVGIWQRAALILLCPLYVSFIYAGQIFFTYQWDMLLVETGFLAIFLTGGSHVVVWLFRLLLFRFLFLAGLVKLTSGDATWQQLTALDYHFFTQPLPSPLAYYAAQLPYWVLTASTAAALIIELIAVVLIFMPRRPRMFGAALIITFQVAIMLTGSYNWFNLLTVLLCLFLFDDQAVRNVIPRGLASRISDRAPRPGRAAALTAMLAAVVLVPVGVNLIYVSLAGRNLPLAGRAAEALAPLLIVNPYGLFATTTTRRPVLAIEGSNDGSTWREYALPFLPGPVDRAPRWSIPYQPRLDWQLWFAAYGGIGQNQWLERLIEALLAGNSRVTNLFGHNPFPNAPPSQIRVMLYDYRFADKPGVDDHAAWWVRRQEGIVFPAVTLDALQRMRR